MGEAGRGLTDDDHQCGNPRGRGGYVAVANGRGRTGGNAKREREARRLVAIMEFMYSCHGIHVFMHTFDMQLTLTPKGPSPREASGPSQSACEV